MSSFSKYIGDFHLYENIEGDPVSCNEAAVFISTKGKLYVYRSKDGDWVVGGYKDNNDKYNNVSIQGTTVGNNKKGVHMRSQDPDRNDYIHECPCQVECQHWVSKDSHDFPVADKELAEDGHRQQQVAGGPLHQGAHQAGQGGHLRDHQDDKETAMLLKPCCKYCLNIV